MSQYHLSPDVCFDDPHRTVIWITTLLTLQSKQLTPIHLIGEGAIG